MKFKNVYLFLEEKTDNIENQDILHPRVLILPNLISTECNDEVNNLLRKPKLLVVKQLKTVTENALCNSNLVKIVANNIETIARQALYSAQFLTFMNLSNVKEIGGFAFLGTNLVNIKNHEIEVLKDQQFKNMKEIETVKMTKLREMSPNAFCGSIIDEFIAPVEKVEEWNDIQQPIVNKCSFPRFAKMEAASDVVPEPDYQQLLTQLPRECFNTNEVNQRNAKLFVINHVAVFPENVKTISQRSFVTYGKDFLFYVCGFGVETVESGSFQYQRRLRRAVFPNLKTIGNESFQNNYMLSSFSAPKCETIGESAFGFCSNLQKFDFDPVKIGKFAFSHCGIEEATFSRLTEIRGYCFMDSALRRLKVENCVTISEDAFNCPNMHVEIQCPVEQELLPKECAKVEKIEFSGLKKQQLEQIEQMTQLNEIQKEFKLKLLSFDSNNQ